MSSINYIYTDTSSATSKISKFRQLNTTILQMQIDIWVFKT